MMEYRISREEMLKWCSIPREQLADAPDRKANIIIKDSRAEIAEMIGNMMADEMIAFLKTVNHARRNNTKVNNIIKEEAAAYFAGNKSLDETVKLIQNRVSILVAESR